MFGYPNETQSLVFDFFLSCLIFYMTISPNSVSLCPGVVVEMNSGVVLGKLTCYNIFFFFFSCQVKPKGVSGLIEIENPNRVAQKTKKASDVQLDDNSTQLSRRER